MEQLKEQLPEEVVKVIIELETFDFKRASEKRKLGEDCSYKTCRTPSQYAYDRVCGKERMEKTCRGNDKVVFAYGKKS